LKNGIHGRREQPIGITVMDELPDTAIEKEITRKGDGQRIADHHQG
jgi:hypothetical protein